MGIPKQVRDDKPRTYPLPLYMMGKGALSGFLGFHRRKYSPQRPRRNWR